MISRLGGKEFAPEQMGKAQEVQMPDRDRENVCVFAPNLLLTVTIEARGDTNEYADLHFHAGGQGFWIARMLRHFGERPVLVAPTGGESGRVLHGLASAWNIVLSSVDIRANSPAYVHDRRSGRRELVAQSAPPVLDRHESDDLYSHVLEMAMATGLCVVTGKAEGDSIPLDFFERLGADLATTQVTVVGDLHGPACSALLKGGGIHTLKVSDEDLVEGGLLAKSASLDERIDAVRELRRSGAERVVLSSADDVTVACMGDRLLCAEAPTVETVDPRGSGDSMTAGLAIGALRGLDPQQSLKVACAAGAASAMRHGLANADPGLVARLADRVVVRDLGSFGHEPRPTGGNN